MKLSVIHLLLQFELDPINGSRRLTWKTLSCYCTQCISQYSRVFATNPTFSPVESSWRKESVVDDERSSLFPFAPRFGRRKNASNAVHFIISKASSFRRDDATVNEDDFNTKNAPRCFSPQLPPLFLQEFPATLRGSCLSCTLRCFDECVHSWSRYACIFHRQGTREFSPGKNSSFWRIIF